MRAGAARGREIGLLGSGVGSRVREGAGGPPVHRLDEAVDEFEDSDFVFFVVDPENEEKGCISSVYDFVAFVFQKGTLKRDSEGIYIEKSNCK